MILVFAIFSAVARAIAFYFYLYLFSILLDRINNEPSASKADKAKCDFFFINLMLSWYEMLMISA